MARIGILACYSAMMTPKIDKFNDIKFISLMARVDDKEFIHGDISLEEYFNIVEKSRDIPRTSQPSTQEIADTLTPMLSEYDFIYIVSINNGLSGIAQNFRLVLEDANASDKVRVIEAESITLSETAVIETIIDGIELNKSIDEINSAIDEVVATSQTFLFPASFKYLKHSGRINGVQALLGAALNMKIFLQVKDGKADVVGKGRGIASILKFLDNYIDENGFTKVYFGQYLVDQKTCDQVINFLTSKGLEVIVGESEDIVAPTHFGPNTFGVCFYKGGF